MAKPEAGTKYRIIRTSDMSVPWYVIQQEAEPDRWVMVHTGDGLFYTKWGAKRALKKVLRKQDPKVVYETRVK